MADKALKATAVIRTEGAVVKFTDSYDGSGFSAKLCFENERVRLTVTPKQELSFEELSVVIPTVITEEDRIFVNGYQSWTDSHELGINDRLRGIGHIPKAIVRKYNFDKYGDYNFTRYGKEGDLHGWTYAYIRRESKYRLFGSVSERCGFTLIRILADRQRVKLSRECEGTVWSEAFEAIDCAVLTGTENEVFDRWGDMAGIKPASDNPPLLRGYTSWYRHYQDISEGKLLHDLEALTATGIDNDIFQIDDGYQTAVGDWLSIDETKFPNGIKPIADSIHERGLKAGLWLAPFVCEKNSKLFSEHPDWILKDRDSSPLAAGCNWSGSYALDINNEEVRNYLRKVFDTVLNVWGFDLVKLDFLYAASIVPQMGKSRGRIMCESMDLLRELCGEKLILGCGVPLGAAFGKVDYCRIGCDVGLDWNDKPHMRLIHRERVSTKNSILNTVFRRQLDGRFFRNDPDVFLLRDEDIALTTSQKRSLALINHLFGSVLFTSDDMSAYGSKQERLLAKVREHIGAEVCLVSLEDRVLTVEYSVHGKGCKVRLDTADGKLLK